MPDVPRGSAVTHLLRSPGVAARRNTLASQPVQSLAACRLAADGDNRQRRSFTFAVTFGTLLLSSTVSLWPENSSQFEPDHPGDQLSRSDCRRMAPTYHALVANPQHAGVVGKIRIVCSVGSPARQIRAALAQVCHSPPHPLAESTTQDDIPARMALLLWSDVRRRGGRRDGAIRARDGCRRNWPTGPAFR